MVVIKISFGFLEKQIKETFCCKIHFWQRRVKQIWKRGVGFRLSFIRCHAKASHLVTGKLGLIALLHNTCTHKNTPYVAVLNGGKRSFQSPVNEPFVDSE